MSAESETQGPAENGQAATATARNSGLAVAASSDPVSINSNRYFDPKVHDELDHQLRRHRADLHNIDGNIAKLEEAIDVDQKRIQEFKLALAEKSQARTRLVAVRTAMARFIQGLQAKDGR
ncbi:hypothetical protein PSQ19_05655 [Devosia algicola]|uniref:DUF4164 family protein n=1 Tax=Devosia algicola TaxID=3026418 RepID=A0ABY7YQW2_9HYPH|nr:hypothetical protein [Devosia algicola]WDR03572.1 hypothetical protein PSQ19_05655 [Devosia algicola]